MDDREAGNRDDFARRMEDLDRKTVWHPFTRMAEWENSVPLVIEAAEGMELIDVRGRRYLDGVSSLWVNVHGHRHPALDEAFKEQIGRIAHSTFLGLSNVPAVLLAEQLLRIAPEGLSRVFYSDNGSTAVEVALKMAFQYWRLKDDPQPRRTRFACLDGAYHGDTIGSVSVGGIGLFHATFRPLLFDTIRIPSPHCYRCPLGLQRSSCKMACAGKAEEILGFHADTLAGLVMEPLVQGAAGMIVHPEGFLSRIKAACDRLDILFIADEVAVGFGRTGHMFACQAEKVSPDLLATAKGITGGYLPLAATLASDRIYRAFLGPVSEGRAFFHGHTYTGNPLAAAVSLANLRVFEEEKTLDNVKSSGAGLAAGLDDLRGHAHVGDVRVRGMMAGVELVEDRETKKSFDPGLRMGARVCAAARDSGVILRPIGDVVIIMPPLAMKPADVSRVVEAARKGIATVTGRE